MNIAIVGAGITGISTALELARDGHHVTVYEQMNAAAEDASFAPSGWLSPSAAQSLAAPGAGMDLQQMQNGNGLLQASSMIGSATWRWMRQWKKHEKNAAEHGNHAFSQALHALSNYSASLRWQDCADTDMAAERKSGSLVFLRTPQEVEFWNAQLDLLQAQGTSIQLASPQQAQTLEPGLGQEIAWLKALHFPEAESINPRLWTQFMRMQAQEIGVRFVTGTSIQRLHHQPTGVEIAGQMKPYDAVVLCTGANQHLLSTLGLQLPLMPIAGYSITAPVRDSLHAPRAAIMDWSQQAIISRMGQRIRITAGLEMASPADAPHHKPTLERMYRLLNDWFPGGAQLSSAQVQVWRGVRGYLPDGLPALGNSGHAGIWVNLAHGSHGASLASGCARALADMLLQRAPAIDMQAFSPLRF
ncbi:NAD(P)/FAD-dependent oxidoreductase [Comamonas sp. NoAH]|uniref:NAD(P)/FAD-dependent oxidoreductase n=1 Tax=Comamonas halotolerans TaxID=3041496 RepID=UPI0024E159EB|nr:FAD-dependent oxidoreductase [Comamonas sp. NoAH]